MIMGIVALVLSCVHLFEEATFQRKVRFALLGLILISVGIAVLTGMSYSELSASNVTLTQRKENYQTLDYIKTCTQVGDNQYQNLFDTTMDVQLIDDMQVEHLKTLALVSLILACVLTLFQGWMIFAKCRKTFDEEETPFLETDKGYGEVKRQTTIQEDNDA
jgi:cadmium resistance protein CadD (predicted permease)